MSNNKVTRDEAEKALKKISQSESFSSVGRNIQILEFLIKSFYNKVNLKETIIAIELFGINNEEALKDGKVRRYMYLLRKKLDEYYRSEGVTDKLIFVIEKGQYNLSIKRSQHQNTRKEFYKYIWLPGILFFAVALFFIKKPHEKHYIWEYFIKSEKSPICCVGEYFLILDNILDGKKIAYYSSDINNRKEFDQYKKQSKSMTEHAIPADFSFTTKMGAVSSSYLTKWFTNNNCDLNVFVESELTADALKESNVVFIGPYKTMGKMAGMFLENSQKYTFDGSLIYKKGSNEAMYAPEIDGFPTEYVWVSYAPLSDNNNRVIYFTSIGDIGVMAAVERFTDKEWLESFYENLPSPDSYFNALFLIKGVYRTNLSCELVDIEAF